MESKIKLLCGKKTFCPCCKCELLLGNIHSHQIFECSAYNVRMVIFFHIRYFHSLRVCLIVDKNTCLEREFHLRKIELVAHVS